MQQSNPGPELSADTSVTEPSTAASPAPMTMAPESVPLGQDPRSAAALSPETLASMSNPMVPPHVPMAAAAPPQPMLQQTSYTQSVPGSIVMRALIVTGDASVIIGKQGRHINEIREISNARLSITESIPSNPERILAVSGPLDAVSKAFGLIVRRLNDEPLDQPSHPGSRAATIRFIMPHARMGSVIGKQGSKIKEIQETSGARLNAGETMLPGSTERVLSITGVADAVHIAVYYVGTILLEHQDRNANNLAYRPSAVPRGMAAAGYSPAAGMGTPAAYGFAGGAGGVHPAALAPGSQTQQIFIPNELVGCIIGKGGQKINEIRQLSASHIKIMERDAGIAAGGSGSERLVTITGPPPNIQMAVTLLYQRLEQEKLRLAQASASGM